MPRKLYLSTLFALLTFSSPTAEARSSRLAAPRKLQFNLEGDALLDEDDWDDWWNMDDVTSCNPVVLVPTKIEDQLYTITDDPIVIEMDPWKPFPEECEVTYTLETDVEDAVTLDGTILTISSMTDIYVKQLTRKTFTVKISGSIGGFFAITAFTTFELTLKNPCFDSTFVSISQVEQMPESLQYSILTPALFWTIPQFSIVSTLEADYAFCGSIEFQVFYNGVRLGRNTSPLAFRSNSRQVRLFSESTGDLGKKTILITPYFSMYPQIRGETISTSFEFVFDPCPFEQLRIDPENPLMDSQIATEFLKPDLVIQFDLAKSVLRSSNNECGALRIEFSIRGKELPSDIFTFDQSSLTVKSQALNNPNGPSLSKIKFAVFLEDFPSVRIEGTPELETDLFIIDPCQFKPRPSICKAMNFMNQVPPQWFSDLDDFVFQLGKESRYEMGEAVDAYGQPILVDVTFSGESQHRRSLKQTAKSFASYDPKTNSIVIKGSKLDYQKAEPRYPVTVTVSFKDVFGIYRSLEKKLSLVVIHLNYPMVRLSDTVYFTQEKSKLEFRLPQSSDQLSTRGARPRAFVSQVTSDGEIQIGWDKPIKAIKDLKSLFERKVAVPASQTEASSVVVFDQSVKLPKWYVIRNAFEVEYLSVDETSDQVVELEKVEIIESNSGSIKIKPVFKNRDKIDPEDAIRVNFWQSDAFVAKESGAGVQVGTQLYVNLAHVVEYDSQESYATLATVFIVIAVFVILMSLLLGLFGAPIIHVWTFVNAMQLLAYSVLVDIPLPANSAYFMHRILNVLRFNVSGTTFEYDQEDAGDLKEASSGYPNWLKLQSLGYNPRFFVNMAPILIMFALLATVCLIGAIRAAHKLNKSDEYSHKAHATAVLPPSVNLMVRFCYETFMEICVVTFLSFALALNAVDLSFSILFFLTLVVCPIAAVAFLYKSGAPRHQKKVYLERGLFSRFICCMEKRELDDGLVGPLTRDGVQNLADFEQKLKDRQKAKQEEEKAAEEAGSQPVYGRYNPNVVVPHTPLFKNLDHAKSSLPMIHNRGRGTFQELFVPEVLEGGESEDQGNDNGPQTERALIQEEEQKQEQPTQFKTENSVLEPENGKNQQVLEARQRLVLEDQTIVNPSYRTLFSGLKRNHPELVAVSHPLFFLMRRVLYAIAIVSMAQHGIAATFLLQIACVGSLCFNRAFKQWNDPLINLQHFCNEVALCLVLNLHLVSTILRSTEQKLVVGGLVIAIVCLAFTGNVVVCLYKAVHHSYLLYRRVARYGNKLTVVSLFKVGRPSQAPEVESVQKVSEADVKEEIKVSNSGIFIREQNIDSQGNAAGPEKQSQQHTMGLSEDQLCMQIPVDRPDEIESSMMREVEGFHDEMIQLERNTMVGSSVEDSQQSIGVVMGFTDQIPGNIPLHLEEQKRDVTPIQPTNRDRSNPRVDYTTPNMTEFVRMEERSKYNDHIDMAMLRKVVKQESLFNAGEDEYDEGLSSNDDMLNQGFSQNQVDTQMREKLFGLKQTPEPMISVKESQKKQDEEEEQKEQELTYSRSSCPQNPESNTLDRVYSEYQVTSKPEKEKIDPRQGLAQEYVGKSGILSSAAASNFLIYSHQNNPKPAAESVGGFKGLRKTGGSFSDRQSSFKSKFSVESEAPQASYLRGKQSEKLVNEADLAYQSVREDGNTLIKNWSQGNTQRSQIGSLVVKNWSSEARQFESERDVSSKAGGRKGIDEMNDSSKPAASDLRISEEGSQGNILSMAGRITLQIRGQLSSDQMGSGVDKKSADKN